jgi:chromosome partitioning protein
MRSVAVTNAKGGVGKSTTAINLSAALAELGRRVLLIDADPSGNATLGLFPAGLPRAGLADMLLEQAALADVALAGPVAGLDVIPPGEHLGRCSDQMGGSQGLGQGREFRVRRVLRQVAGYEVVVIDTSPVQTPLNVAILYAVGEVLIPIDPCVAALAGVRALEDLIRDVGSLRQEFTDAGPLAIRGVLVTRVDRTLVSRQVEAEVRDYFGELVYRRPVPTSVKFREAYARGIPLIQYDPTSAGALAYRAAAAAFLGEAEQPPGLATGPTTAAVSAPADVEGLAGGGQGDEAHEAGGSAVGPRGHRMLNNGAYGPGGIER